MFKKFTSYIEERKEGVDAKGGLVGSPKVKLVADYDGPDPKSPTKGQGQGELSPYKSANGNAAAKGAEKGGFADMGDGKLKYEPDMKAGASKLSALGKELGGDWPKNKMPKTEHFLNKTSKMSASQFAKYMMKENTCDNDAIRYIVALAGQNPRVVEHLVHEMRRANILGEMLKASLEFPEAYQELTILFGDNEGERRANRLARAMAEAVGPPMGIGNNGDANFDGEQDMDDEKVEPSEDDEEGHPDDETDPDEEHDDTDEDGDDSDGDENGDEDEYSDDEDGSDPFGKEDEAPEQDGNPMKKKMPHEHLKDALQRAFMKAFMNK